MKYIINGDLQYNSVDGTLYLSDHSIDMITLNRVTSELLLLLLNNNSVPLGRNTILNELWLKRGLNASSNNLNNYISILRKALSHCGYPDLITTIPKYGFVFEAEVSELVDDVKLTSPLGGKQPSLIVSEYPEPGVINRSVLELLRKKPVKISLILIVLLIVWYLTAVFHELIKKVHQTEVMNFSTCRIFIVDEGKIGAERRSAIRSIKRIVKNESLQCDNETTIIYFSDAQLDDAGEVVKRDLLAYCPDNKVLPCINYSFSDPVPDPDPEAEDLKNGADDKYDIKK